MSIKTFSQQISGIFGKGFALVAACVGLSVVVVSSTPPTPAKAAGTPGVPANATVIYTEDFENGSSTTVNPPALITDYVGATGMTYTAAPFWASAPYCNGIVVAPNSVGTAGSDLCARTWIWDELRRLSGKLSNAFGKPGDQFTVSSYTAADNVPGAYTQIETATPIDIPSGSAFLTLSVDTGANNCGVSGPKYFMKLSDANGVAVPVVSGLISPCTDPNAILDSSGGKDAYLARTVGDTPALITTSDVIMTIENQNLSGRGNDATIDNIVLWDASPQLDKTFEPATITLGETAVARFTITNALSPNGAGEFTRLDAKPGWKFTDALPDGVTVVGTPTTGTGAEECANFSADGTTATSVSATGDLSQGQAYCVVDVMVEASAPGDYTNAASDVTTIGVKPPDDANLTVTGEPAMTLVKSGLYTDVNANDVADVGDTIDYVFAATNTGNVPLVDLVITDPVAGPVTCDPTTIAVGETTTCTADLPYVITQADVDSGDKYNVASADAANSFDPTDVVDATDNTTTLLPPSPKLELDKTADAPVDANNSTLTDAGDTIQYHFTVTNAGNVTMTELRIDDPLAGSATCDTTTLAPGETASCSADALYTITETDQTAGAVVNTATAYAITPAGIETKSNTDEETTPVAVPMPSIVLDKTADAPVDLNGSDLVDAGDTIQYRFTVTNTGNVTLTEVSIDDPLAGSATCETTTLAPGAMTECTADALYTITAADQAAGAVVNTATALATTPAGDEIPSNTDETTTPVATPMPSLLFEKVAEAPVDANKSGIVDAGDTIQYTFTVTNNGDVPVADIEVDDDLVGAVTCDTTTLAVGASTACAADNPYVITVADQTAGAVDNIALATGTDTGGNTVTSNQDETKTVVAVPAPSLLFDKTAAAPVDVNKSGTVDAGDTVRYSFTVTNNGNVAITDVKVVDDRVGVVSCSTTSLAPGQKTDCVATDDYVITAADAAAGSVVNVAHAIGKDPGGAVVKSNDDSTTTPIVKPDPRITLTKEALDSAGTVTTGPVTTGNTLRYRFKVTNVGNVVLNNVTIIDAMIGASTCEDRTLAPNQSTTCLANANYVVTAADTAAGSIKNTAVAKGTDPSGAETKSAPASVVVTTVSIQIPDTGQPIVRTLTAAAMLAVFGAALVVLSRRNRSAHTN